MTKVQSVTIAEENLRLEGDLSIPEGASGVVIFAHGSGSSRLSPRNRFVADILRQSGLATLLFDLLTEREDMTYQTRFDIRLLTKRLLLATAWLMRRPALAEMKCGYFGSSTGAAAALQAAAQLGTKISAVVSRGGRPDLAGTALDAVRSPTLLIVGGADREVLELNEAAFQKIRAEKELKVIEGATHLFEESGTLEAAARAAAAWFSAHLRPELGRAAND